MELDTGIVEVSLEEIIPNRFQPRLTFDEKALTELADSIKQHGIIQPLVLRRIGDKYEIIAGERRFKAAGIAGLAKVPAVIANIDDNTSAEVALVENIQRKNLTAIEEAKSYKNLLDKGYLTQEQLAKRLGLSQSSISNKLRLLNLDETIQDALLNEKISERHARALLQLENKEDQKNWLDKIIRDRLTVRQLDVELKKLRQASDDDGEVPLVSMEPTIEEIKNNATDINPEPEPKIVENFFPEEQNIKPQEIDTSRISNPTNQMPRKFFNFLEDEAANLNMEEPVITPTAFNSSPEPVINPEAPSNASSPVSQAPEIVEEATPVIAPEPAIPETLVSEEQVEVLDMPMPPLQTTSDITPPEPLPTVENLSGTKIQTEPEELISVYDNSIQEQAETQEIAPFANPEPVITEPISITPPSEINNQTEPIINPEPIPETSTTIIYDEEKQNENIVDPVSMIDKLDPEYEAKKDIEEGKDINSAIAMMRQNVKEIEAKGFKVDTDEIAFEDSYQIVIKIEKE